jgi:hypothetical protein
MTRARLSVALVAMIVTASVYSVKADVRADEKTRLQFEGMLGRMVNFFGGKGAREGSTSMVAVKGDRKMTLNDSAGQIVDLNEEKIYDLNVNKKTYKVTTFAEMRRQLEEAQKKYREEARKEQPKDKPAAPENDANGRQMEFDLDIKDTGQKKTINGFETHEVVMTITTREKGKKLDESGGMVLTSDMWLTPSIDAMREVAEFDRRYGEKLAGPMIAGASQQELAAAMAMYPMMRDAIGKMSTEGAKLDGTPVLTTMTMDVVKSADQVAQEAKQGEAKQSEDDNKPSLGGGVGGLLGGLAKRAAQKKAAGQNDKQADNKNRATLMTSTTEILKVTTSVNASELAIPMGYKESK